MEVRSLFNIGFSELIVILLVAFLVVGPKDLPKVARALARGVKRLRSLVEEVKRESGMDEVEGELKQVTREVQNAVRQADIRSELRDAGHTLEREVRDVTRQADAQVRQAALGDGPKPSPNAGSGDK